MALFITVVGGIEHITRCLAGTDAYLQRKAAVHVVSSSGEASTDLPSRSRVTQ
jgi:hypothetical protein